MITEEYIQTLLADIKAGDGEETPSTMYREMMVAAEAERLLNYYAQLKDARYKMKISRYESAAKNHECSEKKIKEIKALTSGLDEETKKKIDWALVGMTYTSGGSHEESVIQDMLWNIRRSISFKIGRLANDWSGCISGSLCKQDHFGYYFPKEEVKGESK